jgi:hypothetical protein
VRRFVLLLALAGCGDLSAETCADRWNAPSNAERRIAARGMTTATLASWRAEETNAGEPGCGVLFRAGPRWVEFVQYEGRAWELSARGAADAPSGTGEELAVGPDATLRP